MIYIRPPIPVASGTAVKASGASLPVQEQPLAPDELVPGEPSVASSSAVNKYLERRKHKDRRSESKDALLETRGSKGRRRSDKPSISILV
jgi:hypothetical protein